METLKRDEELIQRERERDGEMEEEESGIEYKLTIQYNQSINKTEKQEDRIQCLYLKVSMSQSRASQHHSQTFDKMIFSHDQHTKKYLYRHD